MTINPSDTDNEQNKKPLRLNLVAIFSKSVIFWKIFNTVVRPNLSPCQPSRTVPIRNELCRTEPYLSASTISAI